MADKKAEPKVIMVTNPSGLEMPVWDYTLEAKKARAEVEGWRLSKASVPKNPSAEEIEKKRLERHKAARAAKEAAKAVIKDTTRGGE